MAQVTDANIRYVGPRHIVMDDKPTPVPFWRPDRSFENQTVVIVGGGPSHTEMDLNILKGTHFIAVNSSCRKVRPIATEKDLLYFADNGWNERLPELAADWPGLVVTTNRNTKARLGDAVLRLAANDLTEIMQAKPDYCHASSGHTSAILAYVMGARKIVLIGFECQFIDGRSHGHNDYQSNDSTSFNERYLPGWHNLAPVFKQKRVEVINATPNSAIKDFQFMPLEEALK